MPVDLQFSEDQTYFVYTISEPFEMQQLIEAYKQEAIYRDSVSHTVHAIVDMSQLKRVPLNWLTSQAGPGLTHPRSGVILFVGITPGLKVILQTVMRIVRYERMQFFNTRQEADAHMAALLQQEHDKVDKT